LDRAKLNVSFSPDLHEALDGGRNWITVKGVFRIGVYGSAGNGVFKKFRE
jgi:hypothetical protein